MVTTPNLNITHIEASQAQKEVTANTAFDALDVAHNDNIPLDFTSGNVTISDADFRANISLVATNLSVARNLTVPAIKRLFVVDNTAGTAALSVVRGATTIVVATTEKGLFVTDGTTDGLVQIASSAGGVSTFLGLSDVGEPDYTGHAGQAAIVNPGETGIEFGTVASGGGGGPGTSAKAQGVRLRQSANQSLTTDSTTAITFDTEDFDTDAFHDNVTNNTRITIPAGVTKVVLSGGLDWAANATGRRTIAIDQNATLQVAKEVLNATSSGKLQQIITTGVIDVVEGDFFELEGFQDSGGSLNVENTDRTFFAMHVVEAAGTQPSTFQGVRVRRTANLTLTTGSSTAVPWDTEDFDTAAFHDNVTLNTRLIIPDGVSKVVVSCGCDFASNTTGRRLVSIRKNGTTTVAHDGDDTASSGNYRLAISTGPLEVVSGDYFEIVALQNSGGNLDLAFGEALFFSLHVVDPIGITPPSDFAGARATRSTTQSIANATADQIDWDTEDFDTDTFHDTVTNNSRITIPAGVSRVVLTAGVRWAANSTGGRRLSIKKDGTTIIATQISQASSFDNERQTVTTGVIDVAQDDFFEVEVQQNSGGALNVEAAESFFTVMLVDPIVVGRLADMPDVLQSTTTEGKILKLDSSGVWVDRDPVEGLFKKPPALSNWTQATGASATAAYADTDRGITIDVTGAAADRTGSIYRSTPAATNWRVRVALMGAAVPGSAFISWGIFVRENATSELQTFGPGISSSTTTVFRVLNWTSIDNFSSNQDVSNDIASIDGLFWLELEDDGTNRIFRWSRDGSLFSDITSFVRTTHLTPDQWGVFMTANNADTLDGIVHLMSVEEVDNN